MGNNPPVSSTIKGNMIEAEEDDLHKTLVRIDFYITTRPFGEKPRL
jgi:hypothetical protein